MQSLLYIVGVCALFGLVTPSAIPMWEFLSKDEKMRFLYSMFANQVEEFCDSSDMRNCNVELKKYGLKKLKDMSEEYLDIMDPYQRGANNLIWDSMVDGHEMVKTTPKPRSTTTAKPNSYDDESFGDENIFGGRPEASAKIDTIYAVLPPSEFLYAHPQYSVASGTPQFKLQYAQRPTTQYYSGGYQQNVRQEATTERESLIGSEFVENVPQQTSNKLQESTTGKLPIIDGYGEYKRAPLTGPLVVRVHLDGTPVEDDLPLPQDEDLRQYNLSKTRLPNL